MGERGRGEVWRERIERRVEGSGRGTSMMSSNRPGEGGRKGVRKWLF